MKAYDRHEIDRLDPRLGNFKFFDGFKNLDVIEQELLDYFDFENQDIPFVVHKGMEDIVRLLNGCPTLKQELKQFLPYRIAAALSVKEIPSNPWTIHVDTDPSASIMGLNIPLNDAAKKTSIKFFSNPVPQDYWDRSVTGVRVVKTRQVQDHGLRTYGFSMTDEEKRNAIVSEEVVTNRPFVINTSRWHQPQHSSDGGTRLAVSFRFQPMVSVDPETMQITRSRAFEPRHLLLTEDV